MLPTSPLNKESIKCTNVWRCIAGMYSQLNGTSNATMKLAEKPDSYFWQVDIFWVTVLKLEWSKRAHFAKIQAWKGGTKDTNGAEKVIKFEEEQEQNENKVLYQIFSKLVFIKKQIFNKITRRNIITKKETDSYSISPLVTGQITTGQTGIGRKSWNAQ